MSDFKNSLAYLIANQVPDYIRGEYPQFVLFLEKYYEFLDQDNQANNVLLNAQSFSDIDHTLTTFLPSFREQFLQMFPKDSSISDQRLIKFIREFYEAKGSERAIEFLFRTFFNEHVDIFYPSTQILKASGGIWLKDNVMRIVTDDTVTGNPFDLAGKFVKVYTYKTIGNVQTFVSHILKVFEVTQIAYATQPTYELKVEHLEDDSIELPGAGASAIPLIVDGEIVAVTADPEYKSKAFDPDADVSLDYARIAINDHGFDTGDVVIYDAGGYTPIGGMLAYRHYFVKRLDQNYIRLYADKLSLTRETASVFATSANVNTANDSITIANHGFLTGDLVVYRADTTAIGGLTDRNVYYVIKIDANTIKLAETLIDADPRYVTDTGETTDYFAEDYVSLTSYNQLNLTSTGSGNYHVFTKEYFINFSAAGDGDSHRLIRAMDAQGSGYFAAPAVNIVSIDGGSGAIATAHLTTAGGGIEYVTIDATGSGYSDLDTILEFDTDSIRSYLYLNDDPTVKYGYISRTLQSVVSLGCEGTTPLGFKPGQIYDVVESGSAGSYIYTFTDTSQNYFAGDYVKYGVDNKASVQIVTVDADEEPTSLVVFSGGGGFEEGYFTYQIESPTGSVCMLGLTTGSISSKVGRNKNRQGMPSDINMLQDNYYYQNHSYVIRSKVPQSNWMQMVKDTVHPAGMAVFGELLIRSTIDLGTAFEIDRQPIDFYEFRVEFLMLNDVYAVDFIKTLADTYVASDELVSHVGKTLADTSNGFSEEVINDVGKRVVDTSNAVDAIDNFVVEKTLLDIPATSETIYFGFLRTISETSLITDIPEVTIHKILTDGVSISDTAFNQIALAKTDTTYYTEHQHTFHEDISISSNSGQEVEILHTNDHRGASVSKTISENSIVTETGNINIQDYWSYDFTSGAYDSGDYVGSNNSI